MPVYFYRVNEPYGEFSNFAEYPFEADGKEWPTSEHYFQAQKFAGTIPCGGSETSSHGKRGSKHGSGSKFANAARQAVKLDVMRAAIRHKFDSHKALIDLLLSTGDEQIIERTTDDEYWGCGSSGEGLNMLGILLTELRLALKNPQGP